MKFIAATAAVLVLGIVTVTLVNADEESDPGDTLGNTYGPRGKVTLVDDKQNIASTELMGTWVPATEIQELLKPDEEIKKGGRASWVYTFKESEGADERIKDGLEGILALLRAEKSQQRKVARLERSFQAVYLTGSMSIMQGDKEVLAGDFGLVNNRGNPALMYIYEGGDAAGQNIMLARDEDGDADVLWLGGDFNNESLRPYFRKEHADKLRETASD